MEQKSGDDKEAGMPKVPGQNIPANAYNSKDYANLNVSAEISELFQYISHYHARNIELDTKFQPFIPEYFPAVGEVDAFIKVPHPDGVEEALGLVTLVKYII
jgi:intraflagellar transport protein 46